MSPHGQAERGAAQGNRPLHRSAGHVLDDPGLAAIPEKVEGGSQEIRGRYSAPLSVPQVVRAAERLARRAGMDRVEIAQRVLQRIALVELEGVVRLRLDVHAHHVEARPVVAHRRSAGAAEQVEEPRACRQCCRP